MIDSIGKPVIALKVEGMSCGHCVKAVTASIQSQDPNAKVQVDLEKKTVTAETDLSRTKVSMAIEDEGYKVVG
jgi:copper chaperone